MTHTPPAQRPRPALRRRQFLTGLGLAAVTMPLLGPLTGCYNGPQPVLTRLAESRRLATDLRVQFNKAADASNRAVMADTDEASVLFAREAQQATQAIQDDVDALGPLLRGLQYADEVRILEEFKRHFAAYQTLDRSILELAVENTNLKAQRLSFGPAREAADAFKEALTTLARAASPKSACRVESLANSAIVAVREVQILQAPHIAESDDAAMTSMEKDMTAQLTTAASALDGLAALALPAAREPLAAATAALERFKGIHAQIVALSRRNSNVRSLAMTLGQKRALTAACEVSLAALGDTLAKEGFKATR